MRGAPAWHKWESSFRDKNQRSQEEDISLSRDTRLVCTMASEIDTINSIKRRKTDGSVATSLSDLPIGILEHAVSFLSAPSRALLALTFTTNENNPPSENYSSIAGSDWETLDFGEVEKDLATKLSDDDISSILQHIDAVNKVKRLRLTNCTKITGGGLEPLRGSKIIEQIDLSLTAVGEDVKLDPDPFISCELVLPILDSIVAAEGCALKHLQFPYKWRKNSVADSEFHAFILRYNEMRDNRETITCLNCDGNIPHASLRWINTRENSIFYASHNHVCYQCTKHYCYNCPEDGSDDMFLDGRGYYRYCQVCQRDYCKECAKFDSCELCEDHVCEFCSSKVECNECNKTICIDCVENENAHDCFYCDLVYCEGDCRSRNKMEFCERCRKACCNSCRLRFHFEGDNDCIDCSIKLLPHEVALVDQSRRLQQEVEQLKNEVRGLKGVNKELQDEIKDLNKKIKSMAG